METALYDVLGAKTLAQAQTIAQEALSDREAKHLLLTYGQHRHGCEERQAGPCTCGFSEALRNLGQ
jgi:hypothetical protein